MSIALTSEQLQPTILLLGQGLSVWQVARLTDSSDALVRHYQKRYALVASYRCRHYMVRAQCEICLQEVPRETRRRVYPGVRYEARQRVRELKH